MEFNPLSLLEVTMDEGGSQREEDDDDCMIIEPDPVVVLDEDNEESVEPSVSGSVVAPPPPPLVPVTPAVPSSLAPPPDYPCSLMETAGVHFLDEAPPSSSYLPPLAALQPEHNHPRELVLLNKRNLNSVSPAESEHRRSYFTDIGEVLNERLHCTICQCHVGCVITEGDECLEHPLLKVLICTTCFKSYRGLKWPLTTDGRDVRCRWCGKAPGRGGGSPLRYCIKCPFAFCETCLSQNINLLTPKANWICIGCDYRCIWTQRCILWALIVYKKIRSRDPLVGNEDISKCCDKISRKPVNRQQFNFQNRNVPKILKVKSIVINNNNKPLVAAKSNLQKILSGQKYTPPPHNINRQPNGVRFICNTGWLSNKILGYEEDLRRVALKLKVIREELPGHDNLINMTARIETINTLLTLNSNLLKDCAANLMHEWREKRSRFEANDVEVISPVNPANLVRVAPPKSGVFPVRKPAPAKRKPQPKKPVQNGKRSIEYIDLEEEDCLKSFGIEPCIVLVKKIDKNILNHLLKTGSVYVNEIPQDKSFE